jgi:hypothetical protein
MLTRKCLRRAVLSALFVLNCAVYALAQECPQLSSTGPSVASGIRTLEGELIFHDAIRKWFELKLDSPLCEQNSVQLVRLEDDWTPLQVLRGCRVKSTGPLNIPLTGYYSLEMYQEVRRIEPVGSCELQASFPDYSKAKPDKPIRKYRVDMEINYGPGDHPVAFRVSSAGKELTPWQAYANYQLTGGFVLYGQCGEGFVVDRVFGTPEANPAHFEPRGSGDMAAFDPESAAAAGKRDLKLGYTCVRE